MIVLTRLRTLAITLGFSGSLSTSSINSAIFTMRSSLAPRVVECAASVEWHHVLVACDVSSHKSLLCHFSSEVWILRTKVNQHRVVVCSSANDLESALHKLVSKHSCILLHLCLILLVFWSQCLAECHLAAMTCSSGPPCVPGNTELSRQADIILISPFGVLMPFGLGKSLPIMITPPRGPRRVL